MLLDELVTIIETIQSRIREHRDSLVQDEYRTRMALIDPLLTALGWNASDPTLVTPEYRAGNGKADYALLRDHSPVVFIEAKHLGESLDKHEAQVFTYSVSQGVKYASLTDGNRWLLEDLSARFEQGKSRLLDVTLSRESAHQCALKFLLLWHPNLVAGQPIEPNEPVFVTPPVPDPVPEKPVEPHPISPSLEGWIPLSDFQYDRNSMPSNIHLPDGQVNPINTWTAIFTETAEYLVRKGKLTEAACPIGAVVNTKPESPSGAKWPRQHKGQLSNGLFFNRNVGGSDQVRRAKSLLKRFGEDPSSIYIKSGQ